MSRFKARDKVRTQFTTGFVLCFVLGSLSRLVLTVWFLLQRKGEYQSRPYNHRKLLRDRSVLSKTHRCTHFINRYKKERNNIHFMCKGAFPVCLRSFSFFSERAISGLIWGSPKNLFSISLRGIWSLHQQLRTTCSSKQRQFNARSGVYARSF